MSSTITSIFRNEFQDWSDTSNFICSGCSHGQIFMKRHKTAKNLIQDGELLYMQQQEPDEAHNNPMFEIEYNKGIFSIEWQCKDCGMEYLSVGDYQHGFEPDMHYQDAALTILYRPKYFHPNICLFQLHKSIPKPIVEEITKSFSIFFSEIGGVAVVLRNTVKLIMDDLEILGKKGSEKIHDRLKKFKEINPSAGSYLTAIKWIGNDGSHARDVPRSDILSAYDLLNSAMDKIYVIPEKDKDRDKIATEINTKRR